MFASEPNRLISLKESELSTWANSAGVQKYRLNLLIGITISPNKFVFANTLSALHTVPISAQYFLSSRLSAISNITIINEPLKGDPIGYTERTEYRNMEAFGMDFPIFIAIIMSIVSSAHIIFYIKV